jgi:hypothetical protein
LLATVTACVLPCPLLAAPTIGEASSAKVALPDERYAQALLLSRSDLPVGSWQSSSVPKDAGSLLGACGKKYYAIPHSALTGFAAAYYTRSVSGTLEAIYSDAEIFAHASGERHWFTRLNSSYYFYCAVAPLVSYLSSQPGIKVKGTVSATVPLPTLTVHAIATRISVVVRERSGLYAVEMLQISLGNQRALAHVSFVSFAEPASNTKAATLAERVAAHFFAPRRARNGLNPPGETVGT